MKKSTKKSMKKSMNKSNSLSKVGLIFIIGLVLGNVFGSDYEQGITTGYSPNIISYQSTPRLYGIARMDDYDDTESNSSGILSTIFTYFMYGFMLLILGSGDIIDYVVRQGKKNDSSDKKSSSYKFSDKKTISYSFSEESDSHKEHSDKEHSHKDIHEEITHKKDSQKIIYRHGSESILVTVTGVNPERYRKPKINIIHD